MFTKALDSHNIKFHTENTGGKFMAGRDKMGYQVSSAEAGNVRMSLLGMKEDEAIWSRTDHQARTLKGSMGGGPKWSSVSRRISGVADGTKINNEHASRITRRLENASLEDAPRDTMTILICKKKR